MEQEAGRNDCWWEKGTRSRGGERKVSGHVFREMKQKGLKETAGGGPLAVGDVDGDSELEVLWGRMMGGEVQKPGAYGSLSARQGMVEEDEELEPKRCRGARMVGGAVSVMDGDGYGAGAGDAVRVRLQVCGNRGESEEQTRGGGVWKGRLGEWNSGKVQGTVDGDGRMDLWWGVQGGR